MRATATVLAIDTRAPLRPCGATSATRGSTAFATARSWRRPRTTASCRRWSTRAISRRPRCAQSLQRSKLFAALGHNEDFVATVEQAPFPICRGRRLPAVHRRLLGIRRRDDDARGAGQGEVAGRAGCGDMVRRRGQPRRARAGQFLGACRLLQRSCEAERRTEPERTETAMASADAALYEFTAATVCNIHLLSPSRA